MKTLIAIIAFGLFCPSIYSQGTWTVQSSGTTNNLNSVFFTDSNSGYAVGGMASIIRTTNGGASWDGSFSRASSITLSSVYAYGQNAVYVAGQDYSLDNQNPSDEIFKSIDGNIFNNSFYLANSSSTQGLYSLYCTDANTCYTTGYQSVFKTSNGGTNWIKQTNSTIASHSFFSVDCTDPNVCHIAGTDVIIKTIDGGANWTTEYNGTAALHYVFFPDSSTGYAVGDSSALLKTTNGGTTWSSLSFPISKQTLNSVFFLNTATGYIVGNNGIIYRTDNGGTTWIQQQSGTTNNLNSIYFSNANTGYAVGNGGIILKFLSSPSSAIIQHPSARASKPSIETNGIQMKTHSSHTSWTQIFVNGVRNFIQKANI